MNNILKILVISDLHAIADKKFSVDSRLEFENGKSEYAEVFLEYAKSLNCRFDYLVCSGDISNKADKESFLLGWQLIKRIKEDLNIESLLCVPGNHDHISRTLDINNFDPKHYMQYIDPAFPVEDFSKATHFWAWNWCHLECERINSILLNTSAYHGYGETEYKHGRIAYDTIKNIKKYISSSEFKEKNLNILVCHHHPYKMEHMENRMDNECMDGGDSLCNMLIEANKGPWLIIHGHRHIPQIRYAPSPSSVRPLVFSAGSFSATIYPDIVDKTKNQFYVINIDLDKTQSSGIAVGTFETYEWTPFKGWRNSNSMFLPGKGGFGSNITPKELANRISDQINTVSSNFLNQDDLSEHHNHLTYFTPSDIKIFINELEKCALVAVFEDYLLIQVGKQNV